MKCKLGHPPTTQPRLMRQNKKVKPLWRRILEENPGNFCISSDAVFCERRISAAANSRKLRWTELYRFKRPGLGSGLRVQRGHGKHDNREYLRHYDPALYQDGRWNGNASVPMTYTFAVANGTYHVNLYFTETVTGLQYVGARVFNVKLNGSLVFSKLDIFAEAGANAALIKGADVTVTNGQLVVEFDSVVQNPKVHALEILPSSIPAGPPLALNFKYPDGTPVVGTLAYAVSSSLLSFKGSAVLSNGQAQCVIFANPSALGISAQFTVNLSLTDTGGHTLWQLTVAMDPSQVNLGAVQSSALNVVVQKL